MEFAKKRSRARLHRARLSDFGLNQLVTVSDKFAECEGEPLGPAPVMAIV
jgi:hypothetical protein